MGLLQLITCTTAAPRGVQKAVMMCSWKCHFHKWHSFLPLELGKLCVVQLPVPGDPARAGATLTDWLSPGLFALLVLSIMKHSAC
jgi:hypothetical protein